MSDGHVDVLNVTYQGLGFDTIDLFAKITGKAFFKIFCLADINDLFRLIVHAIHTRLRCDLIEKCLMFKNRRRHSLDLLWINNFVTYGEVS